MGATPNVAPAGGGPRPPAPRRPSAPPVPRTFSRRHRLHGCGYGPHAEPRRAGRRGIASNLHQPRRAAVQPPRGTQLRRCSSSAAHARRQTMVLGRTLTLEEQSRRRQAASARPFTSPKTPRGQCPRRHQGKLCEDPHEFQHPPNFFFFRRETENPSLARTSTGIGAPRVSTHQDGKLAYLLPRIHQCRQGPP